MSNLKILCLPPIANTLRDLNMRFTWVHIMNTNSWAILYFEIHCLNFVGKGEPRYFISIIIFQHNPVSIQSRATIDPPNGDFNVFN